MSLFDELNKVIPITTISKGLLYTEAYSVGKVHWESDYEIGSIKPSFLMADESTLCKNYKISIESGLDDVPIFKDFVLIHEYMHCLDQKTCDHIGVWNGLPLNTTFFDSDNIDLISKMQIEYELRSRSSNFIKSKLGWVSVPIRSIRYDVDVTWNFSHGCDNRSDELIANFGACIYLWSEETKEVFPRTSSRFVELLNQGYYGEDAKKIFKHLVEVKT